MWMATTTWPLLRWMISMRWKVLYFRKNVNVVTLTDLSDDYATSETWTDTRMGEIAPDPNGYNPNGWAGGSWAGPADALTSDLVSVGEKNMGNAATLTDFIDWSTTNHAADNYALVIWDHGGGLSWYCLG